MRRVVAITGASAGIGRATALRVARDGASVAICARRQDRLADGRLGVALEQTDPKILRPVDGVAVGLQPPVGKAEHEFRPQHAFDLEAVFDVFLFLF